MNRIKLETHQGIDTALCGRVTALEEGYARVLLHTTRAMQADAKGLVHGGFLFGAADYAAMAAVNDPHVVLGAAEVRFLAPVRKAEAVTFEARVTVEKGKRRRVEVAGSVEGRRVFQGSFDAFVLEKHVLD